MPRKPTRPMPNLLIQGLSDHRTLKPKHAVEAAEFVDELAGEGQGEVHAVKPEAFAPAAPEYVLTAPIAKPVPNALDRMRKQAQSADALIKSLCEPKLTHQAKRGERAIPLGDKLTLIVPPKPWRRV